MPVVDRSGAIGLEQARSLSAATTALDDNSELGGNAKRLIDILAASCILLMLLPLFLFTSAAIALQGRGPILYGHERIGFGGRSFRCWKFRTMCVDGDRILKELLACDAAARSEWATRRKLKNDPRVTPLGRVLREYSVDELPQLLNVLKGDMSLIGPRPVVEEELSYFGGDILHYCSARPGITGLWQVSGRSDTDFGRRVELDTQYVTSWSLRLDLVILLRTIPAVLGAKGSY